MAAAISRAVRTWAALGGNLSVTLTSVPAAVPVIDQPAEEPARASSTVE
jgi:hypothetical protein